MIDVDTVNRRNHTFLLLVLQRDAAEAITAVDQRAVIHTRPVSRLHAHSSAPAWLLPGRWAASASSTERRIEGRASRNDA